MHNELILPLSLHSFSAHNFDCYFLFPDSLSIKLFLNDGNADVIKTMGDSGFILALSPDEANFDTNLIK